jgi:hypothetical protein
VSIFFLHFFTFFSHASFFLPTLQKDRDTHGVLFFGVFCPYFAFLPSWALLYARFLLCAHRPFLGALNGILAMNSTRRTDYGRAIKTAKSTCPLLPSALPSSFLPPEQVSEHKKSLIYLTPSIPSRPSSFFCSGLSLARDDGH